MSKYKISEDNGNYYITNNGSTALTPGGNQIRTLYKTLAERLVDDINTYGINYRGCDSIVPWHLTMIDNFARMRHNKLVEIMCDSFFVERDDWTFDEEEPSCLSPYVGGPVSRKNNIISWLNNCSTMQLTAACCIANAYVSLNIAYIMAYIMERNNPEDWDTIFNDFADSFSEESLYGDKDSILSDFNNFKLYYGIHLDEEGPAIPDTVDSLVCDKDVSVSEIFDGLHVTEEFLLGNNFIHYLDEEKISDITEVLSVANIDLEIDEDNEDENLELMEWLPNDCWVKRFVDSDNGKLFYNLYFVIDDDTVVDAGCIEEVEESFSSRFFFIPGMESSGEKNYEECYYPPAEVENFKLQIKRGRFISANKPIIGTRLPQEMIDGGGNGGSSTEYTYAIQSPYRLAYMHMSIDTTEDGIIESFQYSTYQSSGDGYGDMFTRPILIDDKKEEAIETLLYLINQYTEEEWSAQT